MISRNNLNLFGLNISSNIISFSGNQRVKSNIIIFILKKKKLDSHFSQEKISVENSTKKYS